MFLSIWNKYVGSIYLLKNAWIFVIEKLLFRLFMEILKKYVGWNVSSV